MKGVRLDVHLHCWYKVIDSGFRRFCLCELALKEFKLFIRTNVDVAVRSLLTAGCVDFCRAVEP